MIERIKSVLTISLAITLLTANVLPAFAQAPVQTSAFAPPNTGTWSSATTRSRKTSRRQTNEPGQSTTLLPDGRTLTIGGLEQNGPGRAITVQASSTDAPTTLGVILERPRAHHSATVLPDGTVFVFGGIGADGETEVTAEMLDTAGGTIRSMRTGLTARSHHTATLLTDGRVLFVGGVSSYGNAIKRAEIWDPRTGSVSRIGNLRVARSDHKASLLPDGNVLIRGGIDNDGSASARDEIYEALSGRFVRAAKETLELAAAADVVPPALNETLPHNGATAVPLDSVIALRFSKRMRVQSVSTSSVSLTSPFGRTSAKVIAAEDGMLGFVTPETSLIAGITYTLELAGLTDRAGEELPFTRISFTTAAAPVSQQGPDEWVPDSRGLDASGSLNGRTVRGVRSLRFKLPTE